MSGGGVLTASLPLEQKGWRVRKLVLWDRVHSLEVLFPPGILPREEICRDRAKRPAGRMLKCTPVLSSSVGEEPQSPLGSFVRLFGGRKTGWVCSYHCSLYPKLSQEHNYHGNTQSS